MGTSQRDLTPISLQMLPLGDLGSTLREVGSPSVAAGAVEDGEPQMYRRGIIVGAGATAVALALALIGAASSATAAPISKGAPSAVTGNLVSDSQLAANRVLQIASLDSTFGGIVLSQNGRIELYTTGATTSLVSSVKNAAGSTPVDIISVTRPYSQLLDITAQIDALYPSLTARGLKLAQWGPNEAANDVVVQASPADVASVTAALAKFNGVVKVIASTEVINPASSRLVDSSPWNGGDNTAMDNGSDCSSGPVIINAFTVKQLLTAGHCYLTTANNTMSGSIYRTFNGSHFLGGSGTLMGNASAELDSSGYDDAIINAPGSGLDWRTPNSTTAGTAVKQAAVESSMVGSSVCASGAFDGEKCSAIVSSINQSAPGSDGYVRIHSVFATNANFVLAGPGDSGSPVYSVHSSGLFVDGMLWGTSGGLACPNYNTGVRYDTCGKTIVYQDLTSILNHLGVSLYTP